MQKLTVLGEKMKFAHEKRKKTGVLLIIMSVIAFAIERFSHSISNLLGKLFCGDQYLKLVNGVSGDMS